MCVRWTTVAADDLQRICDYIAESNPDSARRLAQVVVEGVASLHTFPNRGRPGRVEGTRELVFAPLPFVAVYEVHDEVQVLRILFAAQSMSKPVFAYAVLKLCEKGVLDLDTPLTKYTTDRVLTGDARLELITARHVLSHTGGFQNWRSGAEPLQIHFPPGERWLYSGEGYSYLQSVVTHLTGHVNVNVCANYEGDLRVCATDIDEYMKGNLLVPLGMSSSGCVLDATLEARAARPHDSKGTPIPKQGSPTRATDAARYASSGLLHSTPTDYAKFLIEVINPKESDAFRPTKESLDEMVRPIAKVPDDPRSSSWALGWQVFDTGAGTVIAHGGNGRGFHAFAAASVPQKSAFVVMTNGDLGWQVIENVTSGEGITRLLIA